MPSDPSQCFDTETLADLLAYRLPPERFARVEAHVGGCRACGVLLGHLALSSVSSRSSHDASPEGAVTTMLAAPATAFDLVDRGRFLVVREIARGGMGRIVEAWDTRHGRAVALKTLRRPGPSATARFAREARITARLQHPGIIPLYETGRWSDDEPFLAMKLVAGRPLDKVVVQATSVAERLALIPNVIAMTEALAYAHDRRVIHRDLKPSNVLIGSFGETVVIDWGLARATGHGSEEDALPADDGDDAPDTRNPLSAPLSASPALTRVGTAVGTPSYMPPEQARGEIVDARADVYSLGALLYHVLAGEAPYGRASADTLEHVLAGPPEPLRTRASELPPDLLAIVDKAMARAPEDRYPDARTMAEDLRRFEAGKLVAAHHYSLRTLVARWVARHRAVVAMAAVLVAAVTLVSGLSVRRVVRERDRADAARLEGDRQRATVVTQRDAGERLVGFLLGHLRGRLDALGKLELLAGLGSEVVGYYQTLAPSTALLDVAALRRRATALELLSGVEWRQRNVAGATTLMRAARNARVEQSARDPGDVQSMAELALAHASMAMFLQETDAGPEVATEAGSAAAVAGRIEAVADAPAWAYVAVGSVRATLAAVPAADDRPDRARALLEGARVALARAGDFHGLDRVWQDRLASAHFAVAGVGFRTQQWPLVIESLDASVAIRRAMSAKEPDDVGLLEELATSLRWLGEAYENRYEDQRALAVYREGLEIQRALVQHDPGNVRASEELTGALIGLCLLGREWDGPAATDPRCAEARTLAGAIAGGHPGDMRSSNLVARSQKASGESALVAGRGAEARAFFQAAVDASRRALTLAPKNQEMQTELADDLHDVGRAELALGHPDVAVARFRDAMAIMQPRLEAAADASKETFVGELWMLIGDAERGDAARADYARAVALFVRAREADPDGVEAALDLAKASRRLAATEHDVQARSELTARADAAVAPHLAAGRVSPESRAELQASGR